MNTTTDEQSIDRDSAGEKRPERQEYRALVESLPEDRQEAHLRALLVWVREGAVMQEGGSFPL